MSPTSWKEIKKNWTPEHRASVEAEVAVLSLGVDLQRVRDLSGLVESEIADALKDMPVPTLPAKGEGASVLVALREYVEALGGKLEVVAVMGDVRLRLSSIR